MLVIDDGGLTAAVDFEGPAYFHIHAAVLFRLAFDGLVVLFAVDDASLCLRDGFGAVEL